VATHRVVLDGHLQQAAGQALERQLEGHALGVWEQRRRVHVPQVHELQRLEVRVQRVSHDDGARVNELLQQAVHVAKTRGHVRKHFLRNARELGAVIDHLCEGLHLQEEEREEGEK
jgi:hypothetical protein